MLPNLRLVRDAIVQLSLEVRVWGCSATIQMTSTMVNLHSQFQNSKATLIQKEGDTDANKRFQEHE